MFHFSGSNIESKIIRAVIAPEAVPHLVCPEGPQPVQWWGGWFITDLSDGGTESNRFPRPPAEIHTMSNFTKNPLALPLTSVVVIPATDHAASAQALIVAAIAKAGAAQAQKRHRRTKAEMEVARALEVTVSVPAGVKLRRGSGQEKSYNHWGYDMSKNTDDGTWSCRGIVNPGRGAHRNFGVPIDPTVRFEKIYALREFIESLCTQQARDEYIAAQVAARVAAEGLPNEPVGPAAELTRLLGSRPAIARLPALGR